MNDSKILPIQKFEDIFSYQNLRTSANKCALGTSWKRSIQEMMINAPELLSLIHDQLMTGTWRSKGFHCFNFHERGKERHIKSVHILERIVQRTLCDYCLEPIWREKFIHENCACQKGKGTSFAREEIKKDMRQFYGRFGNKGFVVVMDIHNFFGSLDHDILKEKVLPPIEDERVRKLIEYFIDLNVDDLGKPVGIGLGSHVSQLFASIYMDAFDKYVKLELNQKFYLRYNDDFYAMTHSYKKAEELRQILIDRITNVEHLTVNPNKCKIYDISNGFKILKVQWILNKSGQIITRPYKNVMNQYKRYVIRRIRDTRIPIEQKFNDILNWLQEYDVKYTDKKYKERIEERILKELLIHDPRTKDIIENDTLKGSDFS